MDRQFFEVRGSNGDLVRHCQNQTNYPAAKITLAAAGF
jgi:hypothetical protein